MCPHSGRIVFSPYVKWHVFSGRNSCVMTSTSYGFKRKPMNVISKTCLLFFYTDLNDGTFKGHLSFENIKKTPQFAFSSCLFKKNLHNKAQSTVIGQLVHSVVIGQPIPACRKCRFWLALWEGSAFQTSCIMQYHNIPKVSARQITSREFGRRSSLLDIWGFLTFKKNITKSPEERKTETNVKRLLLNHQKTSPCVLMEPDLL